MGSIDKDKNVGPLMLVIEEGCLAGAEDVMNVGNVRVGIER